MLHNQASKTAYQLKFARISFNDKKLFNDKIRNSNLNKAIYSLGRNNHQITNSLRRPNGAHY